MNQARLAYMLAVGFTVFLILGCVACGQHGKQPGTPGGQTEKTQAQTETALVQDFISKNKDFDVCRVKELRILTACGVPSAKCPVQLSGGGNHFSQVNAFRLLLAVGDLRPFRVNNNPAMHEPVEFEALTDKGAQALGKEIEQEGDTAPSFFYDEVEERDVNHNMYKWTLILGCREVQQLDATTSLSDGLKVDFSWHWKTTDIGTADGLSGERQRGVAYFTRTASGLNIDKIEMK